MPDTHFVCWRLRWPYRFSVNSRVAAQAAQGVKLLVQERQCQRLPILSQTPQDAIGTRKAVYNCALRQPVGYRDGHGIPLVLSVCCSSESNSFKQVRDGELCECELAIHDFQSGFGRGHYLLSGKSSVQGRTRSVQFARLLVRYARFFLLDGISWYESRAKRTGFGAECTGLRWTNGKEQTAVCQCPFAWSPTGYENMRFRGDFRGFFRLYAIK